MEKAYLMPDNASAGQAKFNALKLCFAPVAFQVTHALLKLNILATIDQHGDSGISAEALAKELNLDLYGVKILLDVGLSCKLIWLRDNNYILDKTGYFLLTDRMVQINLDFIYDVCYQGLYSLIASIKKSSPEGLKTFGDWKTIYPALSQLPEPAKTSWFNFDHYYSDKAFEEALSIVFAKPVKQLIDIGGNTGKWALQCLAFDPTLQVTIVDLPEQISGINQMLDKQKLTHRCQGLALDILDPEIKLPIGADVIWMSQFLDCFSEAEILLILKRVAAAMDKNTRLYILDLFWDKQKYEAAAYSLNCISIYFTCMANGKSRMYHSNDILKLIHQAGLKIEQETHPIGVGHTLLCCRIQMVTLP